MFGQYRGSLAHVLARFLSAGKRFRSKWRTIIEKITNENGHAVTVYYGLESRLMFPDKSHTYLSVYTCIHRTSEKNNIFTNSGDFHFLSHFHPEIGSNARETHATRRQTFKIIYFMKRFPIKNTLYIIVIITSTAIDNLVKFSFINVDIQFLNLFNFKSISNN